MLPKRFAPLLFVLMLSGLMSGMVCAVATLLNLGLSADVPLRWLHAWAVAWPVAFIVAWVVRSPLEHLVDRLTR